MSMKAKLIEINKKLKKSYISIPNPNEKTRISQLLLTLTENNVINYIKDLNIISELELKPENDSIWNNNYMLDKISKEMCTYNVDKNTNNIIIMIITNTQSFMSTFYLCLLEILNFIIEHPTLLIIYAHEIGNLSETCKYLISMLSKINVLQKNEINILTWATEMEYTTFDTIDSNLIEKYRLLNHKMYGDNQYNIRVDENVKISFHFNFNLKINNNLTKLKIPYTTTNNWIHQDDTNEKKNCSFIDLKYKKNQKNFYASNEKWDKILKDDSFELNYYETLAKSLNVENSDKFYKVLLTWNDIIKKNRNADNHIYILFKMCCFVQLDSFMPCSLNKVYNIPYQNVEGLNLQTDFGPYINAPVLNCGSFFDHYLCKTSMESGFGCTKEQLDELYATRMINLDGIPDKYIPILVMIANGSDKAWLGSKLYKDDSIDLDDINDYITITDSDASYIGPSVIHYYKDLNAKFITYVNTFKNIENDNDINIKVIISDWLFVSTKNCKYTNICKDCGKRIYYDFVQLPVNSKLNDKKMSNHYDEYALTECYDPEYTYGVLNSYVFSHNLHNQLNIAMQLVHIAYLLVGHPISISLPTPNHCMDNMMIFNKSLYRMDVDNDACFDPNNQKDVIYDNFYNNANTVTKNLLWQQLLWFKHSLLKISKISPNKLLEECTHYDMIDFYFKNIMLCTGIDFCKFKRYFKYSDKKIFSMVKSSQICQELTITSLLMCKTFFVGDPLSNLNGKFKIFNDCDLLKKLIDKNPKKSSFKIIPSFFKNKDSFEQFNNLILLSKLKPSQWDFENFPKSITLNNEVDIVEDLYKFKNMHSTTCIHLTLAELNCIIETILIFKKRDMAEWNLCGLQSITELKKEWITGNNFKHSVLSENVELINNVQIGTWKNEIVDPKHNYHFTECYNNLGHYLYQLNNNGYSFIEHVKNVITPKKSILRPLFYNVPKDSVYKYAKYPNINELSTCQIVADYIFYKYYSYTMLDGNANIKYGYKRNYSSDLGVYEFDKKSANLKSQVMKGAQFNNKLRMKPYNYIKKLYNHIMEVFQYLKESTQIDKKNLFCKSKDTINQVIESLNYNMFDYPIHFLRLNDIERCIFIDLTIVECTEGKEDSNFIFNKKLFNEAVLFIQNFQCYFQN
ncbi:hypothetical protein A3Q56_06267 [Intoshia linei]|uniref:Uncharacterized protein n=1 Tax=Intoshia linei TaxID=1819745 RepID=A0A177AVK0_9BILA|nr:hypothetical protein A3Q56_06267 [Intoshia linei]